LRRQANGLLGIILHAHLIINVDALVDYVANLQKEEFGDGDIVTKIRGRGEDRKEVKVAELNWEGCNTKVKEFLESRLPFVLEIFHKDTASNRAAFSRKNPLSQLNKAHMMIHLIISTKERPADHSKLVEAVTRIANIASKSSDASRNKINTALFEGDYEAQFLRAIDSVEILQKQNLEYQPILSATAILSIVKPINDFFDNVLVNAEDEKIKANRQALVAYAHSILSEIGDLSVL
jgi:glycyl-tRNA synthetase beta chain